MVCPFFVGPREAVNDPAFWCYGHAVLYAVHGCLYEFQNWAESCPCHSRPFTVKDGFSPGRPYFARRSEYVGETGVPDSSCPMRGRRAPELAAGRHRSHLTDLANQCLGMLLARTRQLENRDFIIRDFELARTALTEVVSMKFAYWEYIPHKVCILGYTGDDGTIAREGLRDCIRQYTAMSEAQRQSLWPLALHVLDPASPLHAEVVRFTDGGEPLRELPGLRRLAGEVLCIPVCERSIEAKHRLSKLASSRAPNASGAFVNVHLQLPDLRRRLRSDPHLFQRLCDDMASIRTSADRLLDVFDLRGHPVVLKEWGLRGRNHRSTVRDVIYRLDGKTQQQQHKALGAAFPEKKNKSGGSKPGGCSNHALRLLSKYALQQFRKTATKHAFYSMAVEGAEVPHLDDALNGSRSFDCPALLALTDAEYMPPALLARPHSDGEQVLEGAHEDTGALVAPSPTVPQSRRPQHEHLFFKVVHKNPNARHVIKPPHSNLTGDDMAVSVHEVVRCERCDDGSTEVLVALSGVRLAEAVPDDAVGGQVAGGELEQHPLSTRLVSRRHIEALPRLENDFVQWETEGGIFYQPKTWPVDIPEELRSLAAELLTDFITTDAVPGSDVSYVTERPGQDDATGEQQVIHVTLGIFARLLWVTREDDEGGMFISWKLTDAGLNSLAAFDKLRMPTPAVQPRLGIKDKDTQRLIMHPPTPHSGPLASHSRLPTEWFLFPPQDKTVFELICDARQAGWNAQLLPVKPKGKRGPKPPLPPPHDPSRSDCARTWFYSSRLDSIPAQYLRCLLGGTQIVPHGAAAADYARMVKGMPTRFAVEDDTGALVPKPRKRARTGQAAAPLPLALEDQSSKYFALHTSFSLVASGQPTKSACVRAYARASGRARVHLGTRGRL